MLEYKDFLSPKKIWSIQQNKPSLVVDDLEQFGVPRETAHDILLARGVYKWLAVRRSLIKLKDEWKSRVINTLSELKGAKPNSQYRVGYLRGYLKALEECRAEVRALCHSDRWQAPDFDREAQSHLRKLESLDKQGDTHVR